MQKRIIGLSVCLLLISFTFVSADVGSNLISNSSFESGMSAPIGWAPVYGNSGNKSVFTYPVSGYDGARATRIDVSTYKGGDVFWQPQNSPVTPGKQYQFTAYSRNNVAVPVIATYLNSTGRAVSYAILGTAPASATWKLFSAILTPPSTATQVRIQHVIRAVGFVEIDAYYLGLVGATPPPPPPPTSIKPAISSFTSNPSVINLGGKTQLSFVVSNASTTSIDQGVGTVTGSPVTVSPTQTIIYILTATNPAGSATATTTITVNQSPPPPPPTGGEWTEGMVTLSFDDSWISQYTTILPILESAGIKATFYITTEPIIGGWSDFMTPAQVKSIFQKGHEIGDHTITHPHLTQLSQANISKEIIDSKVYLENLTGKSVTTFAYPYGEFDSIVKNLVKSSGYITARGVDEETLNVASTDKYDLKSSCILKSTPFSTIKKAIDDAKSNKQWYILCMHEVRTDGDEYSLTPAQFQDIINYIKQTGIKTVTIEQGTKLMNL